MKTTKKTQDIIFSVWSGLDGTEESPEEIRVDSYQEVISAAMAEVSGSEPSKESVMKFWQNMRKKKLARSEKTGPQQFQFFCKNPYLVEEWTIMKEKKSKREPTVAKAVRTLKVPQAPAEITAIELQKAQARLEELKKNLEEIIQEELDKIKASSKERAQKLQNLEAIECLYENILVEVRKKCSRLQELQELEDAKLRCLALGLENEGDNNAEK